MAKVVIDYDTESKMYTVCGVSKAGEFVISGPWTKRDLAEAHAQRIIGVFNEAAQEIIEASKSKILLA